MSLAVPFTARTLASDTRPIPDVREALRVLSLMPLLLLSQLYFTLLTITEVILAHLPCISYSINLGAIF